MIVNERLRGAPILLSDGRILVWQDSGPMGAARGLEGRCAGVPFGIVADGLAQLEPRLEGVGAYLPRETVAALVEHALHPVISMLEQAAGGDIEFEDGAEPGDADPAPRVAVGFVVYDAALKPVVRGAVSAAPETWRAFDFSRVPCLEMRRHLVVPVQLGVRLASVLLPIREAGALAVGDAIRLRMPASALSDALPVVLADAAGRRIVRARLTDELLTFQEMLMSDIEASGAATTGGVRDDAERSDDLLGEIECEMSFELGSIRLTVADIARLRAGQAIRLGVRLQDQPVRVMVSGRPVARGELAMLGDELVVVISDTSRLPHV